MFLDYMSGASPDIITMSECSLWYWMQLFLHQIIRLDLLLLGESGLAFFVKNSVLGVFCMSSVLESLWICLGIDDKSVAGGCVV